MADHSKPVLTSTYANFVTELDGRFDDLAVGLDPAVTTATNVPTNTIRFSSAASKWQKFNGSSWVDLVATYAINISGNAATATNGVVTSGSYADPAWITSLAGSKIAGNISGNAGTATTLATARTINGVSFNGSANISVNLNNNLTFNNGGSGSASGVNFNGGTATTISYNTIGAPSTTGTGASGTWAINITGNAATATTATTANTVVDGVYLSTAQTITGVKTFSSNILADAQLRAISSGRDSHDWNGRQILVEGNSAPGIGFHAPANGAAGIFKFWGGSSRFEFRNSTDSGFVGITADSLLLSTCNEYAAARPSLGWVTLGGHIYNNTLPGGGTWAWFWGSSQGLSTGINAGGTTLPDIGVYTNGWGFAWRFV